MALGKGKRPDHLATVFAGADVEATETARNHFAPYPPSSPSVAILKDGKVVLHDGTARHREPFGRHDRGGLAEGLRNPLLTLTVNSLQSTVESELTPPLLTADSRLSTPTR